MSTSTLIFSFGLYNGRNLGDNIYKVREWQDLWLFSQKIKSELLVPHNVIRVEIRQNLCFWTFLFEECFDSITLGNHKAKIFTTLVFFQCQCITAWERWRGSCFTYYIMQATKPQNAGKLHSLTHARAHPFVCHMTHLPQYAHSV